MGVGTSELEREQVRAVAFFDRLSSVSEVVKLALAAYIDNHPNADFIKAEAVRAIEFEYAAEQRRSALATGPEQLT